MASSQWIAHSPGATQDKPADQDSQVPEIIGVDPPGNATLPIILNDTDEVSSLPPGREFAGVVALPSPFLTATNRGYPAWIWFHHQINVETALRVDQAGHQIESRQEREYAESNPHVKSIRCCTRCCGFSDYQNPVNNKSSAAMM